MIILDEIQLGHPVATAAFIEVNGQPTAVRFNKSDGKYTVFYEKDGCEGEIQGRLKAIYSEFEYKGREIPRRIGDRIVYLQEDGKPLPEANTSQRQKIDYLKSLKCMQIIDPKWGQDGKTFYENARKPFKDENPQLPNVYIIGRWGEGDSIISPKVKELDERGKNVNNAASVYWDKNMELNESPTMQDCLQKKASLRSSIQKIVEHALKTFDDSIRSNYSDFGDRLEQDFDAKYSCISVRPLKASTYIPKPVKITLSKLFMLVIDDKKNSGRILLDSQYNSMSECESNRERKIKAGADKISFIVSSPQEQYNSDAARMNAAIRQKMLETYKQNLICAKTNGVNPDVYFASPK